ncbi:MAG: BCCT family transporter [Ottowia sp.]|nr:BCCT family transporter [Ottowia sp.]
MATQDPDVPGQGRPAPTGATPRPASTPPGSGEPAAPLRARESARRVAERVFQPPPRPSTVHPALIPGIGVERTHYAFSTNRAVFAVSGLFILGVIAWAIVAPDGITLVGNVSLDWVIVHFGWLFGVLALAVFGFMMVLGYGPAGGVRLGADDEAPEFSTFSWVAMLFSAGMGIGLLFYGPYEPLTYFANPPPGFDVAAGTVAASQIALAQTALHWGPIAWAFYAMVGGAIAYNAYRRGRAPLISAIFEPLLGERVNGPAGSIIDIFAIIVTLFGTAISLGIGALQIAAGTEVVTGIGHLGRLFIVATMAVLTGAFIISAISGVARGIRVLSNTNMVVTGLLALLVLVTGPTLYLFNFYPAAILSFFKELGTMLVRNANEGEATARFMAAWTTYYWAWWITWAPFVGLFIAKISRGRTLREFVTVVVLVPAMVCITWFVIFGGTSMYMTMHDMGVSAAQAPEALLFSVLRNLPLSAITPYLAMFSILVFFVTSADSASIVMSSMTQRGQPEPSIGVTITWGLLLGLTSISLLLAGGENALSGLQSIMVVTALPFAFVLIGMMAAWSKDLYTDPYLLRRKYARAAIAQGVRLGIADFGDDFVFGSSRVAKDEGAGGWMDSDDPALVAWYVNAAEEGEIVSAEDIRRTLSPGRIQPRGPRRPDLTASGDEATATGRTRRDARRRQRPAGGGKAQ